MKNSNRLQHELEKAESFSSFNYILNIHNRIGKKVLNDPEFLDPGLNIVDYRNGKNSAGALMGLKCKKNIPYILYDIDFIRSLYTTEDYRAIVLSSWSLVGHEWGHVEQEQENILHSTIEEGEDDANRRMEKIMLDEGFTRMEIKDGYILYYEIFQMMKNKDTKNNIRRDGKGTTIDFRKCDYRERLKKI
jgi:hypothetical protein